MTVEVIPPLVYAMRDVGMRVALMPRGEPARETTVADSDGSNPFRLVDAKGRPLALAHGTMKKDTSEPRRLYSLLYKPEKDTGMPEQLIFRDRRNVLVEVPFVLKNVPLLKDK